MISIKNFNIFIIISILLSCTVSPRYTSEQFSPQSLKTGKIKSIKDFTNLKKIYLGVSSWYGPNFHGKLTANGEVYDMYGVTAAHKEFPLNTVARVTNIDNGKNIILRINDRGPYVKNRILDCSMGAAKKLEFHEAGTANVKIEIIEWGDDVYMHHD